MIFAEVIGDPIAQSKSPVIHKYWLDRLGIAGDYVRTLVTTDELASFLDRRRSDPDWRGCNITIPHKQAVIPLLDWLDAGAEAIGAVNCVVPAILPGTGRGTSEAGGGGPPNLQVSTVGPHHPDAPRRGPPPRFGEEFSGGSLVGYNTDVDGIAAALDSTELRGRKAAVIGAGGAARAVVAYLASRGVARIALIVRNPERAEALRPLAPGVDMHVLGFDDADVAFGGAAAIINASPLGMAGADPMPRSLLDAVRSHAAGATVFDLVTTPAETEFLSAGAAGGGHPVDGLTMLVGQAARAFELFFGQPAPPPDETLRDLLTTVSANSA
jgi:shikimate dehydrogenase